MIMYYYDKRVEAMKVFISWSGERSNKIAEVLKKWLKHVIQSVEPFVSSQDIPKGARWSTDIAKELQDSNFGILCVTKENVEEPWLLFEAGALSKTMDKSFVVPLLFDLEPSDLSNSPLLQFQATSFSKDEIKKLVASVNAASETKLETHDLDEAFEVWYPQLEKSLSEITTSVVEKNGSTDVPASEKSSQVLEEILALSRDNQKLLRNPENHTLELLEAVTKKLDRLADQNYRNEEMSRRRRKINPMMLDELLHLDRKETGGKYGFLFAISFLRDDFPWLYEAGRDLFDTLKSSKSQKQKEMGVRNFKEMLEYTMHIMRLDKRSMSKDDMMFISELDMILMRLIDEAPFYQDAE